MKSKFPSFKDIQKLTRDDAPRRLVDHQLTIRLKVCETSQSWLESRLLKMVEAQRWFALSILMLIASWPTFQRGQPSGERRPSTPAVSPSFIICVISLTNGNSSWKLKTLRLSPSSTTAWEMESGSGIHPSHPSAGHWRRSPTAQTGESQELL